MNNFNIFKILVCDDSVTNVLILKKLLEEKIGATVATVTDPREVLPGLRDGNFDLLLLDLEMPHMSGQQVLEKVRTNYNVDEFPVLILTGNTSLEVRNRALETGANDFLNKPFDQTEVALRVRNLLRIRSSFCMQRDMNEVLEKKVEIRTKELIDATHSLIHRLAVAGEMKDDDTGQHVTRVGKYSRILAEGIGLPEEVAYMIEKTAPMHDIGKIAIPDEILKKPGRLNDEERAEMCKHTLYATQLLGDHESALIQMANSIALSHHEKWDGSGYPYSLSGESIPVEGRITAIADVFDALTTRRPYKEPWPVERAIGYICDESGKAFDPSLVQVFMNSINRIHEVRLDLSDEQHKAA